MPRCDSPKGNGARTSLKPPGVPGTRLQPFTNRPNNLWPKVTGECIHAVTSNNLAGQRHAELSMHHTPTSFLRKIFWIKNHPTNYTCRAVSNPGGRTHQ
ncbi:sle1_084 (plasmid) [Streptomyces leeuwenhoekii]|uniref:Sle1_084 protein n=1 Tax=Streptomyces leeuwenhoekii TaxID=1437453 RepID=A0A0F7VR20_STRLW|nr:sle1_084 [Streptomyces leeuwenhoekii]